ncbi:MAG: hypothetical protein NUV77_14635 [Thermoguttaceae bacterium]|nr:hypothetical protein [Thermoguttaceae bacterium]
MGQELKHGHRILPLAGELGQVLGHGVVEPDAPVFHEEHYARRGGHGLGERRQVEHRVDRHRDRRRLDLPVPIRPEKDHLAVPTDGHDTPRNPLRLDGLGHGLIDLGEARCIDCGLGGGDFGEPGWRGPSLAREEHGNEPKGGTA